ncbi:hypothetical protein A2230_03205 [candidate division WOR-1 bacterium RIFOXYA2_FULL_36_21]|uniref:Uncharacterized protein n=1 Tax=candidate division WOR-1 bacterium RIFOXYB2_FULL_36_35 TaxID=1802578 RepID=A0A1F4S4V8_UNCSA|nr:MAG: hypothetical protein A2230_03205 [candidate division WOR-1 bacterium RIFOXYA2_FULL_36_21]OGC15407.1 MAG: hypothetical protein A2290_07060 [candidate division WOR-1 bacterium RIFOXYB2_FULL_36_35]OGC21062.1 MAG: hypothetical protein A2282_03460 [candidate division WOR-1 bacterium RIFOXYA12_FULL_36_13]
MLTRFFVRTVTFVSYGKNTLIARRENAIRFLRENMPTWTMSPFCDGSRNLRLSNIKALRSFKGEESVHVLLDYAGNNFEVFPLRIEAIRVLRHLNDTAAIDRLEQMLDRNVFGVNLFGSEIALTLISLKNKGRKKGGEDKLIAYIMLQKAFSDPKNADLYLEKIRHLGRGAAPALIKALRQNDLSLNMKIKLLDIFQSFNLLDDEVISSLRGALSHSCLFLKIDEVVPLEIQF